MTKREAIDSLRKKLQERQTDSKWWNRDLYNALMEQASWLVRREIAAGRIYTNTSFFKTLRSVEVVEVSTSSCPVKTNCTIFRTKHKLPEMWIDNTGPVIKSITSIDDTTEFVLTTTVGWQVKRKDPYQRMIDTKYAFYADGYLWFPERNPHRVNVVAFYTDDPSIEDDCEDCHEKEKGCVRWMDGKFSLPEWLHAECMTKTVELLLNIKRVPEDEQPDKNSARIS